MGLEKETSQAEAILHFGSRSRAALAQEAWQRQEPPVKRLSGLAAHGATAFGRHIDQIIGQAGGGAGSQIETLAEGPQQTEFPMYVKAGPVGLNQAVEHRCQPRESAGLRHPFRYAGFAERAGGAKAGQPAWVVQPA